MKNLVFVIGVTIGITIGILIGGPIGTFLGLSIAYLIVYSYENNLWGLLVLFASILLGYKLSVVLYQAIKNKRQ